jgi:hypothetical protein
MLHLRHEIGLDSLKQWNMQFKLPNEAAAKLSVKSSDRSASAKQTKKSSRNDLAHDPER